MSIDDLIKIFRLLPVLLTTFIGYGQENNIELTGIVQSLNNDISDVVIINLNTKKTTITNTKGFFTLEVKLSDTIQFSAVHYIMKEIIVTDKILNQNMIIVDLKEKVINLDEVVILPNNLTGKVNFDIKKFDTQPIITSSSLGLPKANIKVKTKNERLLFEADGGKLIKIKGSIRYGIGISVNTIKLINKISGKTKKLKDRVLLDKHIKIEKHITNMFPKTTLSEELGIPYTNIDHFLGFCMTQKDFPKSPEAINALRILEYYRSKSNEYKNANGLN